jgi:hypothetical protein
LKSVSDAGLVALRSVKHATTGSNTTILRRDKEVGIGYGAIDAKPTQLCVLRWDHEQTFEQHRELRFRYPRQKLFEMMNGRYAVLLSCYVVVGTASDCLLLH